MMIHLVLRRQLQAYRISSLPRLGKQIFISPYSGRSSAPKPSQNTADDGRNGQDGKASKPQGSYLRALALLAVGVPLGWMTGDQMNDKTKSSNSANPGDFVKYTLVDRQPVSSTCSIFTLRPSGNTVVDIHNPELQRAVTSVQFKQPQLQIARSYTVLPAVDGQDAREMRFLVRREQKGEVSGYLHRLALGAEIEVRGPSVEYLVPERVQKIAFLAGGTGIVPALQIADMVAGEVDYHLLWANRRREDCAGGVSDTTPSSNNMGWGWFNFWGSSRPSPLTDVKREAVEANTSAAVSYIRRIKEQSRSPTKFNVDYFVDEEGSFIRPKIVTQQLSSGSRTGGADGLRDCILFVSGPEGFVNYWAGPKQWVNGFEVQGPLGGILSTLDLQGWKVVKL